MGGISRMSSAFVWLPRRARQGSFFLERRSMTRRSASLSRMPIASRAAGVQSGSLRLASWRSYPSVSHVRRSVSNVDVFVCRVRSNRARASSVKIAAQSSVCSCTVNVVSIAINERVTPPAALGSARMAFSSMYRSRPTATLRWLGVKGDSNLPCVMPVSVLSFLMWPSIAYRSRTPGDVGWSASSQRRSASSWLQRLCSIPTPAPRGRTERAGRAHACSTAPDPTDGCRASASATDGWPFLSRAEMLSHVGTSRAVRCTNGTSASELLVAFA